MEINLLENERIDDLERNGLKIIQNTKGFCFGMDAVLLSGFAADGIMKRSNNKEAKNINAGNSVTEEISGKNNAGISDQDPYNTASGLPEKKGTSRSNVSILDLGTGTGILPILMYAKTDAGRIAGLEIQKQSADMAKRSVLLNDIGDNVEIIEGDIRQAADIFGKSSFDFITCNPPYIKSDSGIVNPDSAKAIARHEVFCTFEDVAEQASLILKPQGKLFLVHRPQRLAEIIQTLKEYRLEPKRMRLVHSFIDSEAVLVLIEAARGGSLQMRIDKPLIIYKKPGEYTDEIYEMYGF